MTSATGRPRSSRQTELPGAPSRAPSWSPGGRAGWYFVPRPTIAAQRRDDRRKAGS